MRTNEMGRSCVAPGSLYPFIRMNGYKGRALMQLRTLWGLGLCVVAVVSSCEQGPGDVPLVVVRDSLGVTIIESTRPAWTEEGRWRVRPEPDVSIGAIQAEAAYQFSFVGDAIGLPDGSILVADILASELRVFSSDGRHVRTFGGEGDGPGELRSPRQTFKGAGDTLYVVDLRSMSTFSLADGFLTSAPIVLTPLGRLGDGSVVGLGWAAGVDQFRLGQVRDPLALVRYVPGGSMADTLTAVPGNDTYRMEVGGGIAQYPPPFARQARVAVRDDRVFIGDGAEFEIRVLASSGNLVEILRRPDVERRLTSGVISRQEQRILEDWGSNDDSRRRWQQLFADWSYPARWPAFEELLIDDDGNLWVRHFGIDPDHPWAQWSVFGSGGDWLGDLELPGDLRVTDIGSDYVLGVATDAFDVEYVRKYTLEK